MMFPMARRSYTAKFTLLILGLLFLTTFSFFLLNYQIEKKMLIDQIRQRAILLGKTLQINLTQLILKTNQIDLDHVSEAEKKQIRDFIKEFGEEETHVDIYSKNEGFHDLFIFNEENRVIIDFPEIKEGRVLSKNEKPNKATLETLKRNEISTEVVEMGNDAYLFITLPLFNEKIPFGFARIEMALGEPFAFLRRIKLLSLLVASGLFLIGMVIATLLARNLTRPIDQLVKTALLIGKGDFESKLNESRQDEIGQLMAAFNRMGDDLKRFEETRKQVEKLEIASRFSAKMAHEIRNPLHSIGLIIDRLGDEFAPTQKNDRIKFIDLTDKVQNELNRLNKIVEDFLKFAKPRSVDLKLANINETISEVLNLIQPEACNQRVGITTDLDSALPPLLMDYDRMRQTFLNLFINAFHAMPDGGKLFVMTKLIPEEGGKALIEVADSGQGIPAEQLSKLFEPYFTTKVNGFGLGLAIVYRIIQEHGGTIEVRSRVGSGTTFQISLPFSSNLEADHV